MLSKVNRLRQQKDFRANYSGGRAYQGVPLIVKFRPNNSEITRFGFVISSRVAKKAVTRNRLRRQMSEIIKKALGDIRPGFDIILVAKPALSGISFPELSVAIVSLLKKAGLLP